MISLMAVVSIWCWSRRNRYWLIETKVSGTVKSKIVVLPLQHIRNEKLRREIKIFNHLCLVLSTVDGVAVVYREQMKKLLHNPKHKPGQDPYERLLYGYACYVLAQKIDDEVMVRQLQRNLLFLFAPQHKIVRRALLNWSKKQYQLNNLPMYKVFADCFLDPMQPGVVLPTPWRVVAHGSYLRYFHPNLTVKRYAHAYVLKAPAMQTIAIKVASDKTDFDCQINRGIITCKYLPTGESHSYTVRGEQVRLATSMCEKIDALEIYVTWQGDAQIALDGGQARNLTQAEITRNQRRERLVTLASQSKYITGERLRARYLAAQKLVPTLAGLTRVVAIHSLEDFFQLWTELDDYRAVARIFQGYSLVLLYSGAVANLTETICQHLSAEKLANLHTDKLWLYLLDRTVIEPDALYFFHKLTQPGRYIPPAMTPAGLVVTKNWPAVKTLTVTNTLPKKMTQSLVVPLRFNQMSVVSARGSVLTVVGLFSGRVSNYLLPVPMQLTGEWLTTHLNIPLNVKLAGYETRQFTITRREDAVKNCLTKKDLATALSEIRIKTDDKKLDAIFTKAVTDGADDNLLSAVKAAFQNQDRKLLITALENRHQIAMEVWQYLLTQIVGLKVRAGKIYLTPCVNIMGEFTITFTCDGKKYAFNTRKKLPKHSTFAIINYGNSNG